MDAQQAVRAFAAAKRELPIEAMRWCRDDWNTAAPPLLELLARYVDGADRSEATGDALLFGLHLFAERKEMRAFPAICRLAHEIDAIERVLGEDGVPHCLASILISTFDGDPSTLKQLIEAPAADEFVRVEAFNALGYLTASGRLSADDTANYLRELYGRLQPQDESFAWYGWAQVLTLLRLSPELVDQAFARGFVPLEWGDEDDLQQLREDAWGAADALASFARERIGPLDDAIDALSRWASFSGEDDDEDDYDVDDDELAPFDASLEEPAVNPYRDVGRNDPCPCGSGKKFKRCCLNAT